MIFIRMTHLSITNNALETENISSDDTRMLLCKTNIFLLKCIVDYGLPRGLSGKESVSNAEDLGSIVVLGRTPGGGNGNPHQYSYLENPTDRGARWATVHGVARAGHDLSK